MEDAAPTLVDLIRRSDPSLGAMEGFARIAAALERTRAELARMYEPEFNSARLKAAGAQLDAIARDAETAAQTIMGAAEKILTLRDQRAIAEQIEQIIVACAFHDIAGQRIRKVYEALEAIEQHELAGPGLYGPETRQAEVDQLLAS